LTTEESLDTAVRKLLRKLFRREATEGEVARYRALVGRHRLEGHTPEECLHLAVRTAMVSPQFLYRGASGEQLAAHDVAARLSYFLTLRPPDEPLAQTALRGELSTPEGVRAQAERLLSTKFCEDFIEDFVGQWLGTRGIPEIMPDASLGRFGNDHRKSVMKEPELLFAEILRENRPLSDFIAPDFTHTHSSVGLQMYGLDMPPVNARVPFAMTRVALPRDSRNGGLLGMAGVMMATANGVDTQPVLRGKWFLENILGDPPPPPPESVPAITPDTRGTKTIRDLMRAHTSDESCARCHEKIDPYGFVFETFDAIGQWRERYPVSGKRQKEDWPAVDATAQLTDGTPLSGIGDLKKRLLEDLRPFARCLTRKLYLYGSGRVPDYSEEKALNALADDAVARHRGFRDFLLDLTASEVFRQR
jgi:hypothetical protein